MAHDADRRRFFAYLNLFVAAMLLLVLADNYVLLYVGWEGVGLASYLLIGFWNHNPVDATAAKKAFVVNRVGDIGLSVAIMMMFATFGTVTFAGVLRQRRRRLRGHPHRDRSAAAARRLRQVGAVPAAVLARRRDGGPDPGVGADPRRDHGHRRRLPDRARPAPIFDGGAHRATGRGDRRCGHPAVRCDRRLRQGRHQEGARRLDDVPDRLHDAGRRPRPGRLRVRDHAPAHPRLLQGRPVPRRRFGDARDERRGRHAPLRRPAPVPCRSPSSRSVWASWRSSASRRSPASSPRTRSSRPPSPRARAGGPGCSAALLCSAPGSPRSTCRG